MLAWHEGDPEILIVLDAGYDAPRIAYLLADLPVQILGRLRSDRVLRRTPPPQRHPRVGRPPRHGDEFVLGDPATWGSEQAGTVTDTRRYGTATARAWDRLHPQLTRRAAWRDHHGVNKPVWLWWSGTDATAADVDRCWQAFLRRFDLEHTFRFFEQALG